MDYNRTLSIYLGIACLFLFFILAGNTDIVPSPQGFIEAEEGENLDSVDYEENREFFDRMSFLGNRTYSERIAQDTVRIKDNTVQEGVYNVTTFESDNSLNVVRIKNDLSRNLTETYILGSYETSVEPDNERNISRDTVNFYYNTTNQLIDCSREIEGLICHMNRTLDDEHLQVKIDVDAEQDAYLINSCQTNEEKFETSCDYMKKFPRN